MSGLWCDVEDAVGLKLGAGPIRSLTRWRNTRRLSAAGEIEARVPLTEPRAQLLEMPHRLRGYAAGPDGRRELGLALLDRPRLGDDYLDVRGGDLLQELAWTSVGDLALYTDTSGVTPVGGVWENIWSTPDIYTSTQLSELTDGNPATSAPIDLRNGDGGAGPDYLYIGHDNRIGGAYLHISDENDVLGTVLYGQYWNGNEWKYLGNFQDGTDGLGWSFSQSGSLTWDIPADMQRGEFGVNNLFWVRLACLPSDSSTGREGIINAALSEVTITERAPRADDVAAVLALAPDWSLDSAYYDGTAAGTLITFAGESVLAALARLAELHGEQFRLAPVGQTIQWLRTDRPTAPVVAVRAPSYQAAGNPHACLIDKLSVLYDGTEIVNRLYAYGAGNAGARLTLEHADDSILPPGYSTGHQAGKGYYVQNDISVTQYGLRERPLQFGEIVDGTGASSTHAATQLLRAAVAHLRRRHQVERMYELTVSKLEKLLLPGDGLRVTYFDARDARLRIDEVLVVLEVAEETTMRGATSARLKVSTVDRWLAEDDALLANQVRELRVQQNHIQPPVTARAASVT
jgi:hypothetical protein